MSAPATTTGDLKTLLGYDNRNIRRPLYGGVFLAPDTAPLVTSLVGANGQVVMPDSYESVGQLSEDGATIASDRELQEVRGWGSTSVLRRDTQSVDVTIQFMMLESKRRSYEVYNGLDLSAVPMSVGGEWKFSMPAQPPTKYWRAIVIGADGTGPSRYYMAKVFGRVSLTENEDETFQNSDEAPRMFGVTLGADDDPDTGGPFTEYIFGPGALAAAQRMGITVASS